MSKKTLDNCIDDFNKYPILERSGGDSDTGYSGTRDFVLYGLF
jgi:hypothetical protein